MIKKTIDKDEEIICGVGASRIRTMYFTGKLDKLLNEIQSQGDWGTAGWERLKLFLSSLQKKDELMNKEFTQFLPRIEIEQLDSVLDELNQEKLSEAEIAELNKEKANREAAVTIASKMIKGLFLKFYNPKEKSPSEDELLDIAFELLSLEYYIMRDVLYKERVFRKKIVEFEREGRQRKLAEEAAKTTVFYRDFYLANGLLEMIREFILLAKKRYRDKI